MDLGHGAGLLTRSILVAIWPYRERPLLAEGLFAVRKPATELCRSWPTDMAVKPITLHKRKGAGRARS